MSDRFIQGAREALRTTDAELSRKLGVSAACLRSWSRRGAPLYVKLALAALVAGLDPERICPTAKPQRFRQDPRNAAD